MRRGIRKAAVAASIVAVVAVAAVTTTLGASASTAAAKNAPDTSSCKLGNGVKHVVEILFDNTHYNRDNPNVLSDLEQMPALKNFITQNGTLLSNMHTPLIAHTADDSLTISVIKDGKVTKHFYFRFTLIFDDPKNRDKASKLLPSLTNDFVVELSQLLTRKLVEESNYDPNIIQEQLQKVCDRRLGKGVVTEVSIANIEQHE